MTAQSLLQQARARLGDGTSKRWDKDRLLSILDSGQKDFCKVSGIFRKEAYIPITDTMTRYNLPADCVHINRLEYDGKQMQLFSRNDLDVNRIRSTEVVALKDHINMNILDIYPSFSSLGVNKLFMQGFNTLDTFSIPDPYGVVTGIVPSDIILDTPYGVVTNIELGPDGFTTSTKHGELCGTTTDTLSISFVNGIYGVVTGMEYSQEPAQSNLFGFVADTNRYKVVGKYGVTGSVLASRNYIKIFYSAMPPTIRLDTQSLVLHDMWEDAMLRYIVGTALQDYNDAGNTQRGELELQKYMLERSSALALAAKDFSGSQKDKLTTRFRRV